VGVGGANAISPFVDHAKNVVDSVNSKKVPNGILDSVSCTTTDSCEAVGTYDNSAPEGLPFAEGWNGAAWTVQTTPNPAGYKTPPGDDSTVILSSVSCAAANACEAVGYYEKRSGATVPLAEAWNGTAWGAQTTPSPPHNESLAALSAVSCTATDACEAVGYYLSRSFEDPYAPFAEAWNGATWTVQTTPRPPDDALDGLSMSGVSCTAVDNCEAVGSYEVGTATFAEVWTGKVWRVQALPDPTGGDGGDDSVSLSGVSCTAIDNCEAVGSYEKGESQVTFAEAWNGKAWSIQSTPNPSTVEGVRNMLSAVSCTGIDACETVGSHNAAVRGVGSVR
jgi:hypothetical protein